MSYAGVKPPRQFMASGQYVGGFHPQGSWQTASSQPGRITLIPQFFEARTSINQLGIRSNNFVAASSVLAGVYDSDSAGAPRTLLGSVALDTSTSSGYKYLTLALTMNPGLYWYAALPVDATNAVQVYVNASNFWPDNLFAFWAQDSVLRNDSPPALGWASNANTYTGGAAVLPSSMTGLAAQNNLYFSWRVAARIA